MSAMIVTLTIVLSYLAAGTVIGGLLLFVGYHLAKAPDNTFTRALMAAFGIFAISGTAFGILLRVMDKTDQPLINGAFWAALGVALVVSYVVTMKFAEIEVSKVPVIWAPLALGLVCLLYLVRMEGQHFRESQGYFRGFERFAYLNLTDPPDAMSTPERAVAYYNQQYGKLRNANEDEGIGKILTTHSHWDLKWFQENYGYIAEHEAEHDITGASKVITADAAQKGQAIGIMSKPLYGTVEKVYTNGPDAIVLMSSGQLARLYKEGKNWKFRNFLRMRPFETKEIYDVKKKADKLTPDDQDAQKWPQNSSEMELKELASSAGMAYSEFDPYFDEEEKGGSLADSLMGKTGHAHHAKTTGYAQLDAAKPNELITIDPNATPAAAAASQENKQPAATAAAATASPQQQAVNPGAGNAEASLQQKYAQVNANLDTQAAILNGQPSPQATVPSPSPAPQVASVPPAGTVASYAQQQPVATGETASPALYSPRVYDNISADSLWKNYYEAVRLIEADDPRGVDELMHQVTSEDKNWFETNARIIADLVWPGAVYANDDAMKLAAAKALLVNMPQTEAKIHAPFLHHKSGVAIAIADVPEETSRGTLKYRALLSQQNGRWFLAHYFFARNFIWLPQITEYKLAHGMPLSLDEQLYRQSRFAPFQQQVRSAYEMAGYGG
jgi:hypothetical protein